MNSAPTCRKSKNKQKVVYRFKGSLEKTLSDRKGQDEFTRLQARLEKASKRPALDRGSHSITSAPQSYTVGQQKRGSPPTQWQEKTKCDEHTCRQTLEAYEKKLGPLAPETLAWLGKLAGLLKSHGKIAEASHTMRVLHMRRRMKEHGERMREEGCDEYGTGANPPMLMRNVPVKQCPWPPKPKFNASMNSTDTFVASLSRPETPKGRSKETPRPVTPKSKPRPQKDPSKETPSKPRPEKDPSKETPRPVTPPRKPRPQSAPLRRHPRPPPTNAVGMQPPGTPGTPGRRRPPGSSVKSDCHAPASDSQQRAGTTSQAQRQPARDSAKDVQSAPCGDPYQKIRAQLVERMAESCVDRDHGRLQMASLLRNTRACAIQMSEQLHLDPERCSEIIQKLETDLGLNDEENQS